MGKVVLIAWIAAIAFGGFWFGYYQEGANESLTIELEVKGNPLPGVPFQMESLTLCSTGSKLAMLIEGKSKGKTESARLIVDMSKKKLLLVVDSQKMIFKLSFDLVKKSQCKKAKAVSIADIEDLKRVPDAKTIAGYRCHAFTAQEKGQGRGVGWFTYELSLGRSHISLINKILRIDPGAKFREAAAATDVKRPQISSFDYFPVPLSMTVRSRQGSFSIKVKSIKRGNVDKSIFELPSDYNELNLEELIGNFIKGFARGMQR